MFTSPLPTLPENFMQIHLEVFANRQTEKQRNKQWQKHNLLGRGNKWKLCTVTAEYTLKATSAGSFNNSQMGITLQHSLMAVRWWRNSSDECSWDFWTPAQTRPPTSGNIQCTDAHAAHCYKNSRNNVIWIGLWTTLKTTTTIGVGWQPCPQWGPGAKPLVGPPEVDNTFCENMLFCHRFKMHSRLYESIQYEMEEKSVWTQKNGIWSNNACPLSTNVGVRLPAVPNMLRRQWWLLPVHLNGHFPGAPESASS